MKISIKPIIRRYNRLQKKLTTKRRAATRYIAKRLSFLVVWRKYLSKQLQKFGAMIVVVSPPWLRSIGRYIRRPFVYLVRRAKEYLRRRPHRSFRMTRRRDYKRSLQLPGYWSFTASVRRMLWRNKKLFGGLMFVYFLLAIAVSGFGQQDTYKNLSDVLTATGSEVFAGNWGKVGQAGLLLTTSITTGLTPNVTAAQSVLGGLIVFFTWLATVWALRNTMAGHHIRVRDAVYSSGSPVVSTVIVAFVLIIQLLPIAVAVLVYNAALYSEILSGGVEAMLAWMVVFMLGVLSLYWITSTIIALVVVTLPGMYPFQAIRTAGDLVVGRRLRILLRLLWAAGLVVVTWLLVLIPVILLDDWLKKMWPVIEWLPTVPLAIMLASAVTIVWLATYIYTLYRKVVDDDASPA